MGQHTLRSSIAIRLGAALALALLAVTIGVSAIFLYTNRIFSDQQVADAVSHLRSNIEASEQFWVVNANAFRTQIEFTRSLEENDVRLRNSRLTAFVASFGGEAVFSHVVIADSSGRIIYRYGTRSQQDLDPPAPGEKSPRWVFGAQDKTLYRVQGQPVQLDGGRGTLYLFAPIDTALLNRSVYPNTSACLGWQGRIVAHSTRFETAPGADLCPRDSKSRLARVIDWERVPGGPQLEIEHDVTLPLQLADALITILLAGGAIGALGWLVAGRWLSQQSIRIQSLEKAVRNFADGQDLHSDVVPELDLVRSHANDELTRLAGGMKVMMTQVKQSQLALEQSEFRYRSLVEQASDGIFVAGTDARCIDVNPAACAMLGLSREAIVGKTAEAFIAPQDLARTPVHYAELRSGKPLLTERELRSSEGRSVTVEVNVRMLPDGLILGIMRDISERKRAEAARSSLEAQLGESQKIQAIGTLAGGIAHDFNNALATILGNAELARQDSAHNPPALESLEEIRKAGTRARNLVQQILAFSRRQPVERKPIYLAPIVTEVTRLLRATLPARLSLEVHCDEVPPVLADASQIEQVLINLATNAMQAMHNGPGRIDIRLDIVTLDATLAGAHVALDTLYTRHPERTVRVTVSDNGPGMDAATKARIFEPFFTTKPVGEGTGLGLSVVHGIVQGHEGAITVDSEPGKGTTFTVYLPVAEAEASSQPLKLGESSPPALALEGGPDILYLDDDESMVFLVERLLKRRGCRVTAHTRQDTALQALRADPAAFDLVVTDYNMPGMSGLDIVREVRALNPNLPVAVTSGFIDEALRKEAAAAGVRELIFKAEDVEVFCASVQRLAQTVRQKTA